MFLLLRAQKQVVALECVRVRELAISVEATAVPHAPVWTLGVFNWRGKILPLVDLRLRLGLPDWKAELNELAGNITAQAADHMEWMEELFRSVEERRPFTKTTDPHACAFGRWYDNFRSENLVVSGVLRKMDAPHKAIHALAGRVEQAKAAGQFEAAKRMIEEARETTLSRLVEKMQNFEQALWDSYRPVTAVLEEDGALMGLMADGVEAVERIDPASAELLADHGIESHSDLIDKLLQRPGGGLAAWLERGRLMAAAVPK
ncbi:MAG: chemotaxis protein CheW [Bryobacteraceae bacterium]